MEVVEKTVVKKRKSNKDLWKINQIKNARFKGTEFLDPEGNVIVNKKTTGKDCR